MAEVWSGGGGVMYLTMQQRIKEAFLRIGVAVKIEQPKKRELGEFAIPVFKLGREAVK